MPRERVRHPPLGRNFAVFVFIAVLCGIAFVVVLVA